MDVLNRISPFAKIGENVTIGDFTKIEHNVIIDDNCVIGDFVKLKSGTRIGHSTMIDDYVNTSGYCVIGNHVVIKRQTMIGQGCEIQDYVQIASGVTTTRLKHVDDVIEHHVIFEEGCKVGSRAVVLAGVRIGRGAEIGAGSIVTKDCEPNRLYVGAPARMVKVYGNE